MSAVDDRRGDRDRLIRARNRALFAVLAALCLLFYAITIARIGG